MKKYTLYALKACPFCHRVLLAIAVRKLDDFFDIVWTSEMKNEQGELPLVQDPLFGANTVPELYHKLGSQGTSVPVLVRNQDKKLISTGSKDIVRWLENAMPDTFFAPRSPLDSELDNIHERLNVAVYRFAQVKNQQDYQQKIDDLFGFLDELECRLNTQAFMHGTEIGEQDFFILPSLLRFDMVYYRLFHCSLKRLADYPQLSAYMAKMLAIPEISDTFHPKETKQHYYLNPMRIAGKLTYLNPMRIVPV